MLGLMLANQFRGNDGYARVLGWDVLRGSGFSPFLMAMTVLRSVFCIKYVALVFFVLLLLL